jgi:cell division protein FtsQ
MMDPDLFPLRRVQFEGRLQHLSKPELHGIVESHLGRNFFAVNLKALRATLAANPWIEEVELRRSWPDTLVVRFQERLPFARWSDDEMVDVRGTRFRPTAIPESTPWPILAGPDGREWNLIQTYQQANRMLTAIGLTVGRLDQDQRRSWTMNLDNGVQVTLGKERFLERLQRFIDVYPQVLSGRIERIAEVDLRYVNGFAERWVDDAGRPKAGDGSNIGHASRSGRRQSASAG